MKALIAYYSRSGHTKAMAEEIAEGMGQEGLVAEIRSVEQVQVTELQEVDVIVFGGPTYYGTMPYQIKKLIDESVKLHGRLDGKIGGAFSSAANVGGGNETTVLSILQGLMIHGMIVQGDPQGDHYGPVAINSPDERSGAQCRRYGKRLALLAKKLFG